MVDILGKKYITEKEACILCGYSKSWFVKARHKKIGAPFIKMGQKKIYYEKQKLESWLKNHINEN